jgi:hypothetical protein
MTEWKDGERVRVQTFNGASERPHAVSADEDYWLLIGRLGTVRQDPTELTLRRCYSGVRVCVEFDDNLVAMGLACHNPIDNSLWILESDLERLPVQ